jgi:DNA replication protein DnaC
MDVPRVPSECHVCHGFGVLESKDGKSLVPCSCREGRDVDARRRAAKIPERYRSCTITNFNHLSDSQRHAKAFARRFVESYPAVSAGILISGPVGAGKTHLAVAILAELLDVKAVRGVFCDFTELLDRIQASFGKGVEESSDDILAPYRDADLLVLDELGARRPSDWARDVLYGLLNTRYNRKRTTILTSNYADEPEKPGGETLELRVGTAVRSRLAEMCQLLPLSGPDYRRDVRPGRAFA